MKFRFRTLFLLLSLFVVASANQAWACGNQSVEGASTSQHPSAKKSCCDKTSDVQSAHATDSGACGQHRQSGPGCPCDHDKGACHCPGCGMACHSCAAFALETPTMLTARIFNASVQKRAFYFAEHLPEAVYLPIWQPPKLGV